ncbi:RNA recognition motif domain-containing protein [Ditylenchus destructor]|nr:RNA recognition motif domain-containing protein [Ditylenchus destructor]
MDSNSGILRCRICYDSDNSPVFYSWEELEIHVASHYSYTPYECSKCLSANQPYKYPTESSLIQHYIYSHPELNGRFYILKYYSEETSEVGAAVLKAMEESMSLLNIPQSLTPSVSGMESVNENETNEALTGMVLENRVPRKRPKREANVTVTNLSYGNGEQSSMSKSIGSAMQPIAQNGAATKMDIIDENLTYADQSQQINIRQILSPEIAYSEHTPFPTDTMTVQNEHYATSHNRPAFSDPTTTRSAKQRHESLKRASDVYQASASNSMTMSKDAPLDPRMKGSRYAFRNAPGELDTESESNNTNGKEYQTQTLKQGGDSSSRKKLPLLKDEKFRKLIVDSLSPDTTDASLETFYSQFGEVCKCYVKKENNQFRGFVTFSTVQEVDRAMMERPHKIDGSRVEPNRIRDKDEPPSTRMYVSKFRSTHTKDDFENYFSNFGTVVDAHIVRNGTAILITFDDYDAVDQCVLQNPHEIANHDCTARRLTASERREFKKYLDFAYSRKEINNRME